MNFAEQELPAKHAKARQSRSGLASVSVLQAGQASFHHALCFHGSGANRTAAPRLSVVGHYMPDGTTFRPWDKVTTQLRMLGPRPRAGQPLAGDNFPLIGAYVPTR